MENSLRLLHHTVAFLTGWDSHYLGQLEWWWSMPLYKKIPEFLNNWKKSSILKNKEADKLWMKAEETTLSQIELMKLTELSLKNGLELPIIKLRRINNKGLAEDKRYQLESSLLMKPLQAEPEFKRFWIMVRQKDHQRDQLSQVVGNQVTWVKVEEAIYLLLIMYTRISNTQAKEL